MQSVHAIFCFFLFDATLCAVIHVFFKTEHAFLPIKTFNLNDFKYQIDQRYDLRQKMIVAAAASQFKAWKLLKQQQIQFNYFWLTNR